MNYLKLFKRPNVRDSLIDSSGRSGADVFRTIRPADSTRCVELLERILLTNILPFWHPQTLDLVDGGYRLNHDLTGRWLGPAPKRLVTQARTLWFFSRMMRTSYGRTEYMEAARHGFAFLVGKMWDSEYGGFFWEVDSKGSRPTMPKKHLYGQAFALYGICEYADAAGDRSARELAERLFDLMDRHAHDAQYGGYTEFFDRDWNFANTTGGDYVNPGATVKSQNTHLHLLEGITRYLTLTDSVVARDRVNELMTILSCTVVRKNAGVATDLHTPDWRSTSPTSEVISYGHNIENITILIEASKALHIAHSLLLDLYHSMGEYVLEYGFDKDRGGLFSRGPVKKRANKNEKVWWVQAEGLLGLLHLFILTGAERYACGFMRTLDWIAEHQIDWERGEWYERVGSDGKPEGVKAGPWKGPYHNGRAVLECLHLLRTTATQA